MNVDDFPIKQSVISSLKSLMPMCRRKYCTKYTPFPGSRKFYPTLVVPNNYLDKPDVTRLVCFDVTAIMVGPSAPHALAT